MVGGGTMADGAAAANGLRIVNGFCRAAMKALGFGGVAGAGLAAGGRSAGVGGVADAAAWLGGIWPGSGASSQGVVGSVMAAALEGSMLGRGPTGTRSGGVAATSAGQAGGAAGSIGCGAGSGIGCGMGC
jgi:hypothetical protein